MGYPLTIWIEDPETGDETEIKLPVKFEVCRGCCGKGTSTSHIDSDGITGEEMRELGDGFMDDYMAGRYDRTCPDCNGLRVEEVADFDALSPAHQKAYEEMCEANDQIDAEMAAERRAGC